jgi:hypothetical protein
MSDKLDLLQRQLVRWAWKALVNLNLARQSQPGMSRACSSAPALHQTLERQAPKNLAYCLSGSILVF